LTKLICLPPCLPQETIWAEKKKAPRQTSARLLNPSGLFSSFLRGASHLKSPRIHSRKEQNKNPSQTRNRQNQEPDKLKARAKPARAQYLPRGLAHI
jgi:hypothetical protein